MKRKDNLTDLAEQLPASTSNSSQDQNNNSSNNSNPNSNINSDNQPQNLGQNQVIGNDGEVIDLNISSPSAKNK